MVDAGAVEEEEEEEAQGFASGGSCCTTWRPSLLLLSHRSHILLLSPCHWSLLPLMTLKARPVAQHGVQVSVLHFQHRDKEVFGEGCSKPMRKKVSLQHFWGSELTREIFPCSFCLCCFKEIGFCTSSFLPAFFVNKHN